MSQQQWDEEKERGRLSWKTLARAGGSRFDLYPSELTCFFFFSVPTTYRKSISIEKRRRITIYVPTKSLFSLSLSLSLSLFVLFVDLHILSIQITHNSKNKDFSDCHLSWASIHIPCRYSNRWQTKEWKTGEKYLDLPFCVCVCRRCWMV